MNPNNINIDLTHRQQADALDLWISKIKEITVHLEQLRKTSLINTIPLEKMERMETENNMLFSTIQNYRINREQLKECEDLQCDLSFIKQHETYKNRYQSHLESFETFKNKYIN